MSAWVGCVKSMSFRLEDIGVDVSDEDTILVVTMGLDKSYDSFIISLNTTSPDQLTLDYIVSHMLNEEVRRTNVEIQGVVMKAKGGEKGEVRVKKEDNVAMVAAQKDSLMMCWHCRKMGHVKAFCMEKPLQGPGSGKANVALAAVGIDSDEEYLTQISDSDK